MEEILRGDHIHPYNERLGVETLHSLISVINFFLCSRMPHKSREKPASFPLYIFFLTLSLSKFRRKIYLKELFLCIKSNGTYINLA